MEESKNYLVHLRVADPSPSNIQRVATEVKDRLEQISGGNCRPAYNSGDGGTFGFLTTSRKSASGVIAYLRNPEQRRSDVSGDAPSNALHGTAHVLIVELGEDVAESALPRVSDWIRKANQAPA